MDLLSWLIFVACSVAFALWVRAKSDVRDTQKDYWNDDTETIE